MKIILKKQLRYKAWKRRANAALDGAKKDKLKVYRRI